MATTACSLQVAIALSDWSTASAGRAPLNLVQRDIFDELDAEYLGATSKGTEALPLLGSPGTSEQSLALGDADPRLGSPCPAHWSLALADTTSLSYPSFPPRNPRVDKAVTQGQGLPQWLEEASGRVTALAASRIPVAGLSGQGTLQTDDMVSRDNLRTGPVVLRVVVGCAGGSIWIMGPRADASQIPLDSPMEEVPTLVTPLDSGEAARPDLSRSTSTLSNGPLGSPPHSPHASPSPTTQPPRRSSSGYPKPLRASAVPLLSPALSTPRSASSATSLQSSQPRLDLLAAPLRLRKASATISVSTSLLPTSAEQFHSIPSPPSTTTPTFPSIIGEARIVSSDAGESRRTSQTYQPLTKDAGIMGLWEGGPGSVSSCHNLVSPALDELPEAQIIPSRVEESLDALEPLVRVRLRGGGEIIQLVFVEGLRLGRDEGGQVIVCFTSSGQANLWGRSLFWGRY